MTILHRAVAGIPRFLLILGFWTLIGLSFAGQLFISSSQLGRPVSWPTALAHSLADWYVIAVLSVLPVTLGRRLGLDGPGWIRRALAHTGFGAAFSILFVAIRAAVAVAQTHWDGRPTPYGAAFQTLLLKTWHFNFLIYWVIVTVSHALEFYRRYQERGTRAAELERRLAEARLLALQMQLNPHFLFNSLHTVSALMHSDTDAADSVIARLSDLLRQSLESMDRPSVPLREEIAFLERYLDIEKARFGDRLSVQWSIPNHLLNFPIPPFLLQPAVENAVRHGIEPHARPGTVRILAEESHNRVRFEVRDSGAAAITSPPARHREGIGLSNTRARLRELHGDNARFEFIQEPGGESITRIEIPAG